MTTITQNTGFKVEFNGLETYFVTCKSTKVAVFATSSKRKAINFYNKASYCAGF